MSSVQLASRNLRPSSKPGLLHWGEKKNPLAVFPDFHFGFEENYGSKARPQKGVNHYKNTKWSELS